jgi:hypothetical protein
MIKGVGKLIAQRPISRRPTQIHTDKELKKKNIRDYTD